MSSAKPSAAGKAAKKTKEEKAAEKLAAKNAQLELQRKAELNRRKQHAGRGAPKPFSLKECCTCADPNRLAHERRREEERARRRKANEDDSYDIESTSAELNDLDVCTACCISRDDRVLWREAYARQEKHRYAQKQERRKQLYGARQYHRRDAATGSGTGTSDPDSLALGASTGTSSDAY